MTHAIANDDDDGAACCNWMQLDAGADAAEDVLALVFGRRVQKGWLDPLTRTGYAKILRNLLRDMLIATAGPERAALQAAIKQVDVDWPSMTAAQQQRRITAVTRIFGKLPNFIIPRVQEALGKNGRSIIVGTKESLRKKHRGIAASFTSIDQRVVDHARTSQAHFIRNQYGQRMESLSAKARDIVANGVAQGLDRYDIADDLARELNAMVPRRQAYWQVVASIFAARSRTYGTLAGFSDAGIEQYEWSSVLDEVTSDVCRFMDGRVFSTGAAVSRFVDVANSKDPEAVVDLQPFVQVGRDRNGEKGLYYKQGNDRVPVARIERSGLGNIDDRGTFSGGMSRGKMEAAGISAPPAHGHCRSLLVAHFTSAQVPSMVSDPSGTQRVPQTPGPKPYGKPQSKPKPPKPYQPKPLTDPVAPVVSPPVAPAPKPPPEPPKPVVAPPAPSPTKPAGAPSSTVAKPFNMFDDASPVAVKIRKKIAELHRQRTSSPKDYEDFYKKIHSDLPSETKIHIKGTVAMWVNEHRDGIQHLKVYRAFTDICKNNPPKTSDGKTLLAIKNSRAERWRKLLTELGFTGEDAEPPTQFSIYRGMAGEDQVLKVARSWKNEKQKDVHLEHHEAASWSWSGRASKEFATSLGRPGVSYHRNTPMERTLYDQAIDDFGFFECYGEHEVIAGDGDDAGMTLDKMAAIVHYEGKDYKYEDRAALFAQLKKDGKTL